MLNRLNDKERAHLAAIKELPCSVCDQAGPARLTTSSSASNTPSWPCARTVTVARGWGGTVNAGCGQSKRWGSWMC